MTKHGSTTTSLQQTKALANCAQGWHPTFILGEKLCVVCGSYAYCPRCQSRPPTDARLMLCALHRQEERRRDNA